MEEITYSELEIAIEMIQNHQNDNLKRAFQSPFLYSNLTHMTTYIVSYDLRKVRDYKSLYEAIDTFTKKEKVLESLWAINTSKTAAQLRDYLSQYMDNDD